MRLLQQVGQRCRVLPEEVVLLALPRAAQSPMPALERVPKLVGQLEHALHRLLRTQVARADLYR